MKTKLLLVLFALLSSLNVAVADDSFSSLQGISAQAITQIELANVAGKCPGPSPLCLLNKGQPPKCAGKCDILWLINSWQEWLRDGTNQREFFAVTENKVLYDRLGNNMDILVGIKAAQDYQAYQDYIKATTTPSAGVVTQR
ncbi:MAG: hypothetical protein WAX77_05720 [Methylococcaceae bacterium]